MKEIPTLHSVSAEYSRLLGQHDDLVAKGVKLDAEIADLHARGGVKSVDVLTAVATGTAHGDRVAALLKGIDYQPPANIRDQIAEKTAERRAVDDALRELHGLIAIERRTASLKVTASLAPDRETLAREFFQHVAAAAKVHARYRDMELALHRSGAELVGFPDFGLSIFGQPAHRNGDIGIALRHAVRDGFLPGKDLPEFAK